MKYLIDGYNLFYQTDCETKEDLIFRIDSFCRQRGKSALVVFDGFCPDKIGTGRVEVRFAGDADREISAIIEANQNPSELILVSSDGELVYIARKNKIKVIKSEHFLFETEAPRQIEQDENPNFRMSDREAERLLEEFNYFKSE
ncbi:NYN domain-containing protein [Patescibacteria group bacterium]|nr:NYN domain-containing protein [Patescibacteria group bacterium]